MDIINILQKATEDGGKVLLSHYRKTTISHKTSFQDIVTEADYASQKIIVETLRKEFVSSGIREDELGFIGEEKLQSTNKYTFIIDPLDGTLNFAYGFDYFCIAIACLIDGKLADGVIYDPLRKKTFIAERGKCAYKIEKGRTQKLHCIEKPLEECLLAAHINADPSVQKKQFNLYERLYPHIRGLRSTGSLVLDLGEVTENIFNIVINGQCRLWDIVGAKLLIEESGGVLVDWQGKEIQLDIAHPEEPYQILACHPNILPEVLKYFNYSNN